MLYGKQHIFSRRNTLNGQSGKPVNGRLSNQSLPQFLFKNKNASPHYAALNSGAQEYDLGRTEALCLFNCLAHKNCI